MRNDKAESLVDLPTIRSQRRFLEGISLICAAYYWFHISIPTRGSLGEWPVLIGSTRYVLPALSIGLVWAAWRYGQQLYRLRRTVGKDSLNDFRLELSRLSIRVVRRYLSGLSLEDRAALGNEKGSPYFKGVAVIQRFKFERARRFDNQHREVAPQLPSGPLGRDSHSVIYVTFDWMYDDAGAQIDYEFGISRAEDLWLRWRAVMAATLMRPAIFDYLTPLLLFMFAGVSLILRIVYGPAVAECV